MQTNLWNVKSSKERLFIQQRTEAHKKHLMSLITIKSKVDDRKKDWRVKSLNADYNRRIRNCISIQNIISIEKTKGWFEESKVLTPKAD